MTVQQTGKFLECVLKAMGDYFDWFSDWLILRHVELSRVIYAYKLGNYVYYMLVLTFFVVVSKEIFFCTISTQNSCSLKLVDKFTYLGSSVSSSETDINMWLAKARTAINWLMVIWKSDLTDKMKCSFFQAAVVMKLLYGCTSWTLTKHIEKKLDSNYTRML